MSQPDRSSALARIRTAMIEKKMTQAELADTADCHEKTIQNLLNGRSVRDQTLFDVCMVLDLDFVAVKKEWNGEHPSISPPAATAAPAGDVAPVHMGAYSRAAVDHYVGSYLTLRPAFGKPDAITAYRTDIVWHDDPPYLAFEESERIDETFAHKGQLYVPASSMYIHLVSLTKGAMRTITASQLDQAGLMRGLITTLHKQNAQFSPVSAPIIFRQSASFPDRAFGDFTAGDRNFDQYRDLLKETISSGYARLIQLS